MKRLLNGKLPDDLLARLLADHVSGIHPRVLAGPTIGLDVAALEMGDRVLVWKSDPITFANDRAGWYAVHVNANDIATSGADPLAFQATVLLPQGTSAEDVDELFAEIRAACDQVGCLWCGGHTEVTAGVNQVIISGTMIGEVRRENLLLARGGRPGDVLVLAGYAAVEGTAIIAREKEGEILRRGVSEEILARGKNFLDDPGISVLPAARLIREYSLHAMHDPTEGGVLRGAVELARASGCGLRLQLDAISLRPETRVLCQVLGLDPLATIASGALLIACVLEQGPRIVGALREGGIPAAVIGHLTDNAAVLTGECNGQSMTLDPSPRDEITKLF